AEVAQLYVSAKVNGVYRPARELKGFQKVFLKAGASKTVTIPLDDKAFRYFNVKTNKFEIEGGDYDILIGASVEDIKLSGTVTVEGTGAELPYDMSKLPSYAVADIKNVSDEEFTELLGHPIPDGHWSGTLEMNDAICQLYYAKSLKARLVYKLLTYLLNKSIEKGTPDLNITFIYNMPFRAIGKMAGGMCSQEMCEGILTICNGHAIAFFKGLGKIIAGFVRQQKIIKKANSMT
ncbi:MAG: fibronectin type III-like domain-contianing protein, partial [Clostridiales bacterium]|nr:fibronectin type III-like domain-contianing protein [Clostridiales bacterium]